MITQARLKELLRYNKKTGVFTWRVDRAYAVKKGDIAGYVDGGYVRIEVDGRYYRAHRLAWLYVFGVWPTGLIDHRDTNGTNNTFKNLRDVGHSVNGQNKRRAKVTAKSPLLGISAHGARWRAQISVGGTNRHLGLFDSEGAAHRSYVKAKRELHEGNTL